jgi:hypothetical protein
MRRHLIPYRPLLPPLVPQHTELRQSWRDCRQQTGRVRRRHPILSKLPTILGTLPHVHTNLPVAHGPTPRRPFRPLPPLAPCCAQPQPSADPVLHCCLHRAPAVWYCDWAHRCGCEEGRLGTPDSISVHRRISDGSMELLSMAMGLCQIAYHGAMDLPP